MATYDNDGRPINSHYRDVFDPLNIRTYTPPVRPDRVVRPPEERPIICDSTRDWWLAAALVTTVIFAIFVGLATESPTWGVGILMLAAPATLAVREYARRNYRIRHGFSGGVFND